jgi:hypothetical protein
VDLTVASPRGRSDEAKDQAGDVGKSATVKFKVIRKG